MPADAHAYAGMTWLLVLADAAIDARHRTGRRWHDMLSEAFLPGGRQT